MSARLLALLPLIAMTALVAVGCSDPPPAPEPVALPDDLDAMADPDGAALKSVADLLTSVVGEDVPPEATRALREAYDDAVAMAEKLRRLGAFRQDLGLQGSALLSDVQQIYYRQLDRLFQMRDSLVDWLASRNAGGASAPLNPAAGSGDSTAGMQGNGGATVEGGGSNGAEDTGNGDTGAEDTGSEDTRTDDGSTPADPAALDDAPEWFTDPGELPGEDLRAVGSRSGDARAASTAETVARARLGERVQGVVAAALAAITDVADLARVTAVQVWSLVAAAAERAERAWGSPTADGKTTAFVLVRVDLEAILDVLDEAWQTVAEAGALPGDRESWRAALTLASSQ